jgi:hypothetical protein
MGYIAPQEVPEMSNARLHGLLAAVLLAAACGQTLPPRHPARAPAEATTLASAPRLGVALLRTLLRLGEHIDWVSRPVREIPERLREAGYELLGGEVLESHETGTHAYVAARGDDLVVSFRGTGGETLRKWVRSILTDLRFGLVPLALAPPAEGQAPVRSLGGLQVHAGFQRAYLALRPRVLDLVRSRPSARVFVTGHSLGGALATLASLDLAVHFGRRVHAFLFAAPRVGDEAFARSYGETLPDALRITHVQDPIPLVPPHLAVTRYVHVGRLLAFLPEGILASARDLAQGFASRLRLGLHFQKHYRAALRRTLAWCEAEPTACEEPEGPDRLAAAADAERAFAAKGDEALRSLLGRLFGLGAALP